MDAAQFTLFNVKDYVPGKIKKKRVHYKKPTYTKSYTFYSINPDTNDVQYLGDEKHIFRIKALQRIYSLLYGYCNVDLFETFESKEIDGLTVWGEDKQAEITNTWKLPIKQRVLIHLKLLRLLRQRFTIKQAQSRIMKGL